jgi:hypothetical protein
MRKVVFGLMLALGMSLLPVTAAQADPVSDEAAFVAKTNQLRASKGLPPLQLHQNLLAKARTWSTGMAAAGRIWHSTLSDGITADWKKLGENVGMGSSVDTLHAAFVASPHHYANLVDPAFSHVGIGIAMSGNTIFVTEVFMQLMGSAPAVAAPTTTPTAPRVTTPTAPRVTTTIAPRVTTTTAPKPVVPKTVTAAVPVPVVPAAPPAPPAADPPVPTEPPAPAATPAAPADPPRAPSALLVSVLERLRSFDS